MVGNRFAHLLLLFLLSFRLNSVPEDNLNENVKLLRDTIDIVPCYNPKSDSHFLFPILSTSVWILCSAPNVWESISTPNHYDRDIVVAQSFQLIYHFYSFRYFRDVGCFTALLFACILCASFSFGLLY